jgi:hypothetical protein
MKKNKRNKNGRNLEKFKVPPLVTFSRQILGPIVV